MPIHPAPDLDLAAHLFEALHEKTFDGLGVTRDAYGPGEQAATTSSAPPPRAYAWKPTLMPPATST